MGPFLDSKPIVPGLRSLLVSVEWSARASYPPGFLKEFKLIRILDLTNVIVTQTGFHDITQLIHLRLLGVFCETIPPYIVNLLRLEVLRFHSRQILFLPNVVMKMTNLRHIFASTCCIKYTEDFYKMVPDMSSALSNLETLTTVLVYDELCFERLAQRLPNIQKIGIRCFFCVHLSSYFKKLESLKLAILSLGRRETVAISPSTLDFPSTLKKLYLMVPLLSGSMISSIGKLSNLEVLKLEADFKDDRWDVEDDEFLQLKYFFFRISNVQEWNASDESFPCLEQVLVRNCHKMRELPARFGSVTTLRRIEVDNCSENLSNSFQKIVEDQMDAGNEGLKYSIS